MQVQTPTVHLDLPQRPSGAWRTLVLGAAALLALTGCGGDGAGTSTESTAAPETTMAETTEETSVPSAPATGGTAFDALEIGQCVQFSEVPGSTPNASGAIDVTHTVVDCNLVGEFKYQVATSHSTAEECPSTDYVQYYQEGLFGNQGATYCMAPVFEVGTCYGQDPINDYAPIDCNAPEQSLLISSEVEGTDTASCPDPAPEANFVLPEPAPGRVYCLG